MARRQQKTTPAKLDPFNLEQLVGQTRLVDVDGEGVYYPVTVTKIEISNCAIKAIVTPIGGIGDFEICLGDLLTKAEAHQVIEEKTQYALAEAEYEDIMCGGYIQQKRAAFLKMLEKEITQDEIDLMQEDLAERNSGLKKCSESFIREHSRRIIGKKYGVELY